MALNRIACPECGAGLKSPTGFTPGQTVCCPKCETYFAVEDPGEADDDEPKKGKPATARPAVARATAAKKPVKAAALDDEDDEDDDEPKARKKKKKAASESSYKNSPLRFAVLGVLLVVLGVLAYMLYQKKQKEKEEAARNDAPPADTDGPGPVFAGPGPGPVNIPNRPVGRPGGPGGPGGFNPAGPGNPNVRPPGGPGGPGSDPVENLIFGPAITPAERQALTQKYKTKLVGTWKADLGDGTTVELVYKDDGTVSEARKTKAGSTSFSGKWQVVGLAAGRRGVVVKRDGFIHTHPEVLLFEDDELEHPIPALGVSGVFRRA